MDFKNPVRSGDRLDIEVVVRKLGRTSMGFHFRAVGKDGTLVAEGDVTRVCVDEEFRPTAIPAAFRKALEPHVAP